MKQTDYIENIEGAERRMLSMPIEYREEGDTSYFVGTGIQYNAVADLGYFTEEILPGAADEVLNDDVRGLFNHDPNYVLGRTASGTMKLEPTELGVTYRIAYNPADPDHVRVREKAKRGDISQSSFAFTVKEDSWEDRNGKEHRKVIKISRLYDMSLVTYPAYPNTTAAVRSMQHLKQQSTDSQRDLAEMDKEAMKLELGK